MAHIRRHPVDNSKWQVRYIDPTGRERSKTFRRKVDAEKYLIHVEAQKQRSEWINPELSSTLFEDWAEGWLANRTHLKPKTFSGYESLLKVHILPRFGSTRLDRIDSLSIEDWIADLKASGLSASRIRQAHNVLSQILKTAVRARYLPANSADRPPPQATAGAALPHAGRSRPAGRRGRGAVPGSRLRLRLRSAEVGRGGRIAATTSRRT